MPEKQFQIHNTTRDPRTRLVRARSPITSKMTLLLGGGSIRVLRHRPAIVYESVIRRMLSELVHKETWGLLKVTTLQGERVDLSTMRALEKAPAAVPMPHPPVDSAARDKGAGIPFTRHGDPKGIPQGVDAPIPQVGRLAIPEGDVPREESKVLPNEGVPLLVRDSVESEPELKVEEPEVQEELKDHIIEEQPIFESFDAEGQAGKKSRRRRK